MNFKNKLRAAILVFALAMFTLAFAACGNGGDDTTTTPDDTSTVTGDQGAQDTTGNDAADPAVGPVDAQSFRGLPADTAGELTIMMWGGDDSLHRDIGGRIIPGDELGGINVAAIHAVAREFNTMFPNIRINLFSQSGDPDRDYTPWEQHRENFYIEHGLRPDIFTVTDLVGDIMRGQVADLSVFEDDPRFQQFNSSIMGMMNFEGRQFAMPQYMIPAGVFVNRDLANQNNIDIPPINWTWEQYLAFVSHHSVEEWYGSLSPPWNIMNTGTRDIQYQLVNRGPNDPFVNIDTEANREFIRDVARIVPHAMWNQRNSGNISDEFMAANGWWSWFFFARGSSLTLNVNSYMMGYAAIEGGGMAVESPDWDIFPRPSTAHVGNHIGVVLDPMAIHNYAGGTGVMTPEQELQLRMAWEFVVFLTGNTRSFEVRQDQIWYDSAGASRTALNPSMSFVTGQPFYDQMEIWGRDPARARFMDASLMPGWQRVMELWEQGQFWEVSDKSFPWTHEFEGGRRAIWHEWGSRHTEATTGAPEHEPQWVDLAISLMPEWDRVINERWAQAFEDLSGAIGRFYPVQPRFEVTHH